MQEKAITLKFRVKGGLYRSEVFSLCVGNQDPCADNLTDGVDQLLFNRLFGCTKICAESILILDLADFENYQTCRLSYYLHRSDSCDFSRPQFSPLVPNVHV